MTYRLPFRWSLSVCAGNRYILYRRAAKRSTAQDDSTVEIKRLLRRLPLYGMRVFP